MLQEAKCWRSPQFGKHYATVHKRQKLQRGITRIKHALSDQSLYLMPEFQTRLEVGVHTSASAVLCCVQVLARWSRGPTPQPGRCSPAGLASRLAPPLPHR